MRLRIWWFFTCAAAGACAPATAVVQPDSPPQAAPVHISGPGGPIASTRIRNEAAAVTRTVAAPLAQVWSVLPGVYEALGIARAGADPAAKAFGNLEFHPRRLDGGKLLSTYIDCGRGITAVPRADEYAITMSVRTDLTAAADGGTVVATTVQAVGKPQAVGGNAVYCASVGKLEGRIIELVQQALVELR